MDLTKTCASKVNEHFFDKLTDLANNTSSATDKSQLTSL